ncbi:MAG TPA: LysR family transcriptional regulator [Opitutaceae bacterium]
MPNRYRSMELRHLHSFLALAEELHFGRAADRVGIAQPALSRHIQQLEAEIGSPLFERGPRSVTLTRAGREFLERVRPHVDGITQAIQATRNAGHGLSGRLAVGYVSNLSYQLLPAVISRLKAAAPEVTLDLKEMPGPAQVPALRTGEINVAMLVLPIDDFGLMQRRIFQDPLIVVMPIGHELAQKSVITLADLCRYPFIACPRYERSNFQNVILERCHEAGYEPQVVHEVTGKTLMYGLIAHGIGISVVPRSSSYGHREGVVYRPLAETLRPIDVGAVWRKEDEDPLRKLFVETTVAAAEEIYGGKTKAVA